MIGCALVVGDGCPSAILPSPTVEGAPADLVVVAPDAREAARRRWLDAACDRAVAALPPDGVVYLLAPRHLRREARRGLDARGLRVATAFLHVPGVAATRHLLPLDRKALSFAIANVAELRSGTRRRLLAVARGRALPLLEALAEPIGIAAVRPGSRPLFEWLFRLGPSEPLGTASISRSWRGGGGTTVLHRFAAGATGPSLVAKLPPAGGREAPDAHVRERAAATARSAGAQVPRPLGISDLDGRPVLLETALGGRPAAHRLAERPRELDGILVQVVRWLRHWNLGTADDELLTPERLHRDVLRPARQLAPALAGGDRYLGWLERRCAAVAGKRARLVSAHNDLTMSNVLLADGGSLGIVDWEHASERALPLVDFHYAAADAVSAARGHADRVAAARECFAPAGSRYEATAALRRELASALDVPPDVDELAFHACWLRHAANETAAGDDAEFRAILSWVAEAATGGAG